VLSREYGNDPAQTNAKQTAADLSDDRFALWLAPDVPANLGGGRVIVVGQEQPLPAGVPTHTLNALLRRAVAVYAAPLGPEAARELPFDLLADARSVPVLDLRASSPARENYANLWTLLLSHGLHLGCATTTDARLDLGSLPLRDRTFVRLEGKLGAAEVGEALRRGASFVSTGPALSFAVGDALPGESVPANDQTQVADLDAVLGCVPGGGISRLELLRAGQVVRTWDVSEVGPNHVQARIAIRERTPTWFALRACGADPSYVAWTSPVYFADPAQAPPTAREATIRGKVTDKATGAAVAGARLTATTPGTRPVTAVSGADGAYELVAPVTAAVEVTHPAYRKAEPSVGARTDATTKFVAWDSREAQSLLQSASARDLLTWDSYERLQRALAAPRIDFALTPR